MSELKIFTEYPERTLAILQKTIRTEILRIKQGKSQIEQNMLRLDKMILSILAMPINLTEEV